MSFLAGEKLTAALLNALISRNCSEADTAAAEATSSTTYVDLATTGPSITISSAGTVALVIYSARMYSADATVRGGYCDYTISGATTRAADDATAISATTNNAGAGFRMGAVDLVTITPGSNTFTLKYRSTGGSKVFQHRKLIVFAP